MAEGPKPRVRSKGDRPSRDDSGRSRARRVVAVVGALVVVVVGTLVGVALSGGGGSGPRVTTGPSTSAGGSSTSAPGPATSAPAPGMLTTPSTYAKTGPVEALAVDGDVAYAGVARPQGAARSATVVRVDRATGRVTARWDRGSRLPRISGIRAFARAGGHLWVAVEPDTMAGGIVALDPATLTEQRFVALDGGARSLAATPGRLWIARVDGRLVARDPSTGSPTAPMVDAATVGGPGFSAASVAASADGRVVYVAGTDARRRVEVVALDPTTGRVEHRFVGGPGVAAAAGAVRVAVARATIWASYPSGRTPDQGDAVGLRASDLAEVATLGHPGARPAVPFTNALDVVASPGTLWLADGSTVACADPSTGAVGAQLHAEGAAAIAADARGVAWGNQLGVLLRASPACP